ncbi:MFS transporter-like protein [Leptodontidium sp. MPI-SDFR-AT-0119]|nr:MFS transporter-like protein [Leptodontidium sp. MPI-SDFR-AT-0119]
MSRPGEDLDGIDPERQVASQRNESLSEKTIIPDEPEELRPSDVQKPDDVPPDGGYGWVVVACVSLINGHTWGINSSYGVFLAHYLEYNTFPGASALEYAFIGGLSISMALIIAPLATVSVGRFGTQFTLSLGILLETAGLLGASWAYEIWHLFLSQGLAFGFGMGFLFVASVGLIPQWFSKHRSFANSIAAAGSGIGGLIYSLATNAMIQSIGLGWAFRVLAIISCAVNIICTFLIRDRNKLIGSVQMAFDVRLFKRVEFLLLLGWGFFSMLGYIVLLFSLPSYARSVGLTASQGSVIGALLNLGQGLGRPFVGYFSDSFGRINMAGTCTFLAGLFCLVIWIFAKSYGVLIFFSIIVGTVAGTFWTTIGPVGAEVVGIKILPSALSIVWLVLVIPCTFSEPIGLEMRQDSSDIYLHAQLFTGFMYIGAALCMWFLRAWKIQELARLKESKEQRERDIRDDDAVVRPNLSRHASRISVKDTVKVAKGLWSWQRV